MVQAVGVHLGLFCDDNVLFSIRGCMLFGCDQMKECIYVDAIQGF
jgi:hypothetical protein